MFGGEMKKIAQISIIIFSKNKRAMEDCDSRKTVETSRETSGSVGASCELNQLGFATGD